MSWWFSEIYSDLDQLQPILRFYDEEVYYFSDNEGDRDFLGSEEEISFLESLPMDMSEIEAEDVPKQYQGDMNQWMLYSIKKFLIDSGLAERKHSITRSAIHISAAGREIIQSQTPVETYFERNVHLTTTRRHSIVTSLFSLLYQFLEVSKNINEGNDRAIPLGIEHEQIAVPFSGVTLIEAAIFLTNILYASKDPTNSVFNTVETPAVSGGLALNAEVDMAELEAIFIGLTPEQIKENMPLFYAITFFLKLRSKFNTGMKERGIIDDSGGDLSHAYMMYYSDYLWLAIKNHIKIEIDISYNHLVNYYARSLLRFFLYSPYFRYGDIHEDMFCLFQTFDINEEMPFDETK